MLPELGTENNISFHLKDFFYCIAQIETRKIRLLRQIDKVIQEIKMTHVLEEVSKQCFIFWPELPGQLTQFSMSSSGSGIIKSVDTWRKLNYSILGNNQI